jgi:4-alpha-glucanotransferase
MNRSSGLFLHPTSLPSRFGIGDLGITAYNWVEMLIQMKQSFWQVCPLGPTGYGDSPYQSFCSFAGNSLLISPELLKKDGLLIQSEIDSFPLLSNDVVDYGAAIIEKEKIYEKAYARFNDSPEFLAFCEREHYWLHDYSLFRVLKDKFQGLPWYSWDIPLKLRYPAALEEVISVEWRAIRYQKFLQFVFSKQWIALKEHSNKSGISIIGDVPYYIAYDSSDAWASPELFEFDEYAKPVRVAGVPPDYFSATGQLWGNPLYQWEMMRQDGYRWWIRRIRKTLELVDFIRLDHFRGFESYWAVPATSNTAINGVWVKGPGIDFFNSVRHELGMLPIIAEDLGEITHDVEQLRLQAGLNGMKVLQFAFDGNPDNPYLPYNIYPDSVTYTGTHDNDTSMGWFKNLSIEFQQHVKRFLGCTEDEFHQWFLRLALSSPSKLCIIPFQDVLGLGTEHRMNTPGTESGNWKWRFTEDLIRNEMLAAIADLTSVYGRSPKDICHIE